MPPRTQSTELTALLHAAYAGLGAVGFKYTAVDQLEEVIRKRVARGDCLLALGNGMILGTAMFHTPGRSEGCPCYERPDVATIGQFGVFPGQQGQGVGALLLQEVEARALASGAAELALDTFEGADHLIAWYERHRFRFMEHAQWTGNTYRSVIMSKMLGERSTQPASVTAAV